jgi:hypothetical protein
VPYEISPEPDVDAREALELALDSLGGDEAEPAADRSRWRALGVSENVEVLGDRAAAQQARCNAGVVEP